MLRDAKITASDRVALENIHTCALELTSSLQTTKLSWSNTVGCRISRFGNTPQVSAVK